MTINPVSSSSATAIQPPDSAKLSERIFKKADTDKDGTITLADLEKALKDAPASADGQKSAAAALFAASDANKDGSVSQSDLQEGLKKIIAQNTKEAPAGGGKSPQGVPTSGGADKSGGSGSSSSKIVDKKDANKDGTVTYEEEQDYLRKHPEDAEEAKQKQIQAKTSEPAPYARTGTVIDTQA